MWQNGESEEKRIDEKEKLSIIIPNKCSLYKIKTIHPITKVMGFLVENYFVTVNYKKSRLTHD